MKTVAPRRSVHLVMGPVMMAVVLLGVTPALHAQWSSGFEPPEYLGNAAGIDLNGQQGFFNPVLEGSVSADVYDYAGNFLGIPANPDGGLQFAVSEGPGSAYFSRSQRACQFGDGTGLWMVSFDILVTFTGTLPTAQYIGSFSTQDSFLDATFIAIAAWSDPATAAGWNADYQWYDSAGYQYNESVANPGFQNLWTDHWYRWTTLFNLDTNRIVEVAITDLVTGATARQMVANRYLFGGAAGSPPPDGFRLFAGTSSVAGNTLAWDNIVVARPEVLILQDLYPWGMAIMRQALIHLGVAYEFATSSDLATIDLDRYRLIMVPSVQSAAFYTAWNENVVRFENWVLGGGHLWLSTCNQAFVVPEPLTPGGVVSSNDQDLMNILVDPDHRWVYGVPGTVHGTSASHDSFTNLYPGSTVVAETEYSGRPTLIEYGMGAGRVFLSGMTVEYSAYGGLDGAPILANSVTDLMGWTIFTNRFQTGDTTRWSATVP